MTEFWFKPKQRGIGFGVPIHWKGWALFAGLLAAIVSVPTIFEFYFGHQGTVLQRLGGVIAISLPFLYVAWRKTEGGWRWRSRRDELDDGNRA